MNGLGTLYYVPNELIIKSLTNLSLEDLLKYPRLSKATNYYSQNHYLWTSFFNKKGFAHDSKLCPKSQLPQYRSFLKLFSEWNDLGNTVCQTIRNKVSLNQFALFLSEGCPTTWWGQAAERYNPEVLTFRAPIGENQFEFYCSPYNWESWVHNLSLMKEIEFFPGETWGYKDATSSNIEKLNVFQAFGYGVIVRKLEN